jgi:hypothetical protein
MIGLAPHVNRRREYAVPAALGFELLARSGDRHTWAKCKSRVLHSPGAHRLGVGRRNAGGRA